MAVSMLGGSDLGGIVCITGRVLRFWELKGYCRVVLATTRVDSIDNLRNNHVDVFGGVSSVEVKFWVLRIVLVQVDNSLFHNSFLIFLMAFIVDVTSLVYHLLLRADHSDLAQPIDIIGLFDRTTLQGIVVG